MTVENSDSPVIEYETGNMDEIVAIHAFYGRAMDEGFTDLPEYEASAVENFILGPQRDRDLANTLTHMSEWGKLERVFRDGEMHRREEIYRMEDETAKSDSFTIWKYSRDEYSGEIGNMMEEFEQGVREDLEEKGVSLLK